MLPVWKNITIGILNASLGSPDHQLQRMCYEVLGKVVWSQSPAIKFNMGSQQEKHILLILYFSMISLSGWREGSGCSFPNFNKFFGPLQHPSGQVTQLWDEQDHSAWMKNWLRGKADRGVEHGAAPVWHSVTSSAALGSTLGQFCPVHLWATWEQEVNAPLASLLMRLNWGALGCLKGQDALQKDLGRLTHWAIYDKWDEI